MWETLKRFIKAVTRPITYAAESLLLFAVNNNFNMLSTLLIKCGVNVNCNNSDGTVLWHAVNNGNLDLVKKLLANNADVNSQENKDSRTVLHLAAQKKVVGSVLREDFILQVNNKIIDALIAANPDINLRDKDGKTSLHIAASRCYLFATKALIKAKADVNIQDNEQETPIMCVVPNTIYANNNARDILRVLIFARARLDLVDKNNRTVLQKVADYNGGGFDKHLACKTLVFYGAKLEELTERINNQNNQLFVNRMMNFEPKNLHSKTEHDQANCIRKSASIRESIINKMDALRAKKITKKHISILHENKNNNIPEIEYPNHKKLKAEMRCLNKGCKAW